MRGSMEHPVLAAILAAVAICAAVAARAQGEGADAGAGEEARPPVSDDPRKEAGALEMSGVRDTGIALLGSDPPGARVLIDGVEACATPCHVPVQPGRHVFTFEHPQHSSAEVEADVVAGQQLNVHGRLGQRHRWKLAIPTFFVGAIFTAGGISSLVVHSDTDPQDPGESEEPADTRRFQRNLGIVSLVVGVPLLALSVYLLAAGEPGEGTATPAAGPEVSLVPAVDGEGASAGASIVVDF